MSNDKPKSRWGAGHLGAMTRLGFHELQNAFVNPGGNIAAPTEYGSFGSAMPSEVQRERNDDPDVSRERVAAMIDRIKNLAGKVPEREDREPERE